MVFPTFVSKVANAYKDHTGLTVDLRGVANVNDESMELLAAAGVKWGKLDLGGTTEVTHAGILVLGKVCPDLLVR